MSRSLGRSINTGDDLKQPLLARVYPLISYRTSKDLERRVGFHRSPWRYDSPPRPTADTLIGALDA